MILFDGLSFSLFSTTFRYYFVDFLEAFFEVRLVLELLLLGLETLVSLVEVCFLELIKFCVSAR